MLVNRRLIELTRFARQVEVAVSGEDALELLRNASEMPDWIFLDMHLPGMNGLEFLEELSVTGYNHSIIILLSVRPDRRIFKKLCRFPVLRDNSTNR